MLIIAGSPLPEKIPDFFNAFSNKRNGSLHEFLQPQDPLSEPESLRALCSHFISRILAKKIASVIDQPSIPVYSHAKCATFCAIYIGNQENVELAIDAEYNKVDTTGIVNYFQNTGLKSSFDFTGLQKIQLLKIWLAYETSIKLHGIKLCHKLFFAAENIRFIVNSQNILLPELDARLKFICLWGHLLCIGSNRNIFSSLTLRWLHPLSLLADPC